MSRLNLTYTFLEPENSSVDFDWETFPVLDLNSSFSANSTSNSTAAPPAVRNYLALLLLVFPFLTLFGNVLVILAVYRERSLQTATNYYIISLALADLLVAVVVMPFAVYFQVNGEWGLPAFACDFYIAMDVTCSTSSIFNLVAISIDRYIAVTQPIKYAKQKNNSRAWLLIILVWVVSIAIGSPIVLGLNYTPNRIPGLCIFYNTDFIIYSSLSSFYIPCVIMVFLYYSIFKALRNRAKKQRAARKPPVDMKPGIVIENVAQTRRLAETSMVASALVPTTSIDDGPTNTGSGSQDEDDEGERSPGSEDCHVIPNDKSTEFILATVIEETVAVGALTAKPGDEKGNNDSGYAASQLEDIAVTSSPPASPHPCPVQSPVPAVADTSKTQITAVSSGVSASIVAAPSGPRRNGSTPASESSGPPQASRRPLSASVRTSSEDEGSGSKKERKATAGARFTIYKVNKASRKKREKSSAKKERKATKTLAIVLGVFLFCWVPFFTCNVMDAICTKLEASCTPSLTAFLITTWLGYMNSFVNPVIYTIFNPEFRKAFKKIMMVGT